MKINVFPSTQPHCWIKKDELWRLPFCMGFDKNGILNWIWNRVLCNIINSSSITIFIM